MGCTLIQVVLREELTVVVNDRWSLNAGGLLMQVVSQYKFTLIQVVLREKLTVVVNDRWSLNAGGLLMQVVS